MKALLEGEDPPDAGPNAALWEALSNHGYSQPAGKNELGLLLDRAGDRRFLGKSAWFQRLLSEQDPDQVVYEALLEGLGYRFNQQPFLKLAQRSPYAALAEAAAASGAQRARRLESLLMALAGFPPIGHDIKPARQRSGFGPRLVRKGVAVVPGSAL